MKIKFLALAFLVASLAACSNSGKSEKECCAKGEEKECCDKAATDSVAIVADSVAVADTAEMVEVEVEEVEETAAH